jgi:hypothetical protein
MGHDAQHASNPLAILKLTIAMEIFESCVTAGPFGAFSAFMRELTAYSSRHSEGGAILAVALRYVILGRDI